VKLGFKFRFFLCVNGESFSFDCLLVWFGAPATLVYLYCTLLGAVVRAVLIVSNTFRDLLSLLPCCLLDYRRIVQNLVASFDREPRALVKACRLKATRQGVLGVTPRPDSVWSRRLYIWRLRYCISSRRSLRPVTVITRPGWRTRSAIIRLITIKHLRKFSTGMLAFLSCHSVWYIIGAGSQVSVAYPWRMRKSVHRRHYRWFCILFFFYEVTLRSWGVVGDVGFPRLHAYSTREFWFLAVVVRTRTERGHRAAVKSIIRSEKVTRFRLNPQRTKLSRILRSFCFLLDFLHLLIPANHTL
jgi:hypothetical protein